VSLRHAACHFSEHVCKKDIHEHFEFVRENALKDSDSFGLCCLFPRLGQFCLVLLSRSVDSKSSVRIGFRKMAGVQEDARIKALGAFVKLVPVNAAERPPARKAFSAHKLDDEPMDEGVRVKSTLWVDKVSAEHAKLYVSWSEMSSEPEWVVVKQTPYVESMAEWSVEKIRYWIHLFTKCYWMA
jgi:hypothetical protein